MALDPATIQAGISIGSKVLGGLIGGKSKKKAAKKAAKAQEAAARRQEAAAKAFDERTQKQTEPYRQFGAGATNKLSDLLGIDSVNPEYERNLLDFNTADAEYNKLLNAKSIPQKTGDILAKGDIFSYRNKRSANKTKATSDATLNAKSRLDASRARLDGTSRNSARSDGFGSLLKSFSENDLNNDVVYNKGLQFGLDQGERGINNRALAMGSFDSGAALKELTRFGNDYGNQRAGDAQQRFMGDKGFTFNSLLAGSGVGQNAIGQSIGSSATALNGKFDAFAGQGNARAGNAFAQGAANNEMFSNIGKQFDGFNFGGLFGKKTDNGGTTTGFNFGGRDYTKTRI